MNDEGASCLGNRRIKYLLQDNVEYVDVERGSCLGNGGIKNTIKDIVEYNDVEGASSLGSRGIKYFYTGYCRIY